MTRKETILHVATKLFSEKGYRNTTIAELAEHTGVAEGTIFYHFKTKEGLFLAILENIRQTLIGEFKSFSGKKHLIRASRCWRAASFSISSWSGPKRSCS
jgi:AcrR family transcriptional regulator